MPWLTSAADGVSIAVRVTPRSSRNRIDGEHGDALKIRLQAPPVEGKANEALVEFLSDRLNVPAGRITIASGERGRTKRVLVSGLSAAEVRERLRPD